ncbi:sensor histidine kinase [Deinococcus sp. QL22]|uniref:sensor histidine kinase n=1 Tax=Deinococcus sp. QL22 TaxID=2939437 RepID=UPI002017D72D|nr:sensor histidine kinase [Deinococcus sp. QL22]UQN09320.1 sensor histidine kinase [Deinococcus sp. QL22]
MALPTAALTPFGELRHILRGVGLATWLAVSTHALLALPGKPWRLTQDEYLSFGLCLLGFGAVLWVATDTRSARWPLRIKLWLCALEVGLALIANHIFNGNSLLSGMLLVTAMHVGAILPMHQALLWVAVQTLGLFTVLSVNWPLFDAVSYTTGYLCFQVFAVLSAQVAVREVQARQRLTVVVEELQQTRALLVQASRDAERLRIARELHDLVGHHLTALTMNLQVAEHGTQDERSQVHVERAGAIAKLLLSSVREAVGAMRSEAVLDIRAELDLLQQRWTDVQVHATLPENLAVIDPLRTQVLLRCSQEIVANAVKHGAARNVWLILEWQADCLHLHAHDDGRGVRALRPGCGLKGMQERLESIGGQLKIDTHHGAGVVLLATLPLIVHS